MALKIYDKYQPLAKSPTAEYPTGAIKNKSSKNAQDGTPIEADWANDFLGMRDAILAAGNVTADGNVETATNSQVLAALKTFLATKGDPNTFAAKQTLNDELEVLGNANFTTMPKVGGSYIVESGSNANGEYTKWADGTMIQWGNKTFIGSEDASFSIGGTINLPAAFKNSSYSALAEWAQSDSQTVPRRAHTGNTQSRSAGGFLAYFWTIDPSNYRFNNGDTLTVSFIAIGKWK